MVDANGKTFLIQAKAWWCTNISMVQWIMLLYFYWSWPLQYSILLSIIQRFWAVIADRKTEKYRNYSRNQKETVYYCTLAQESISVSCNLGLDWLCVGWLHACLLDGLCHHNLEQLEAQRTSPVHEETGQRLHTRPYLDTHITTIHITCRIFHAALMCKPTQDGGCISQI